MAMFLGLDIGTTSTIGMLVELPGRVKALASRPVTLHSDHPGWAEEDPEQWWANVCALVPDLLAQAGGGRIAAVGVTGMLPAVVLLDEDDRLIRRSIQQSDGRCGAEVAEMRKQIDEAAFLHRAGNGVNQQLVGAKLRWLARHEPENHARIATVFGSYDYVNWRLTGAKRIEQNWALEAGVVDVASGTVDPELAAMTGVPFAALPPRSRSTEVIGHVTAEAALQTGLAEGTPVIGGAADMIASAYGAGIRSAGDVLLKFGGAVDILTATERVAPDARLYLDDHLVPGLMMPNGCMSTGGSVLNWFVATFCKGIEAPGGNLHGWLDARAAKRPAGADDLLVLPYFLGEKTPIHDPAARGVIEGLTLSHDLGHLWRAVLESYAFALRHHVEVLRDMGHPATRFVVSDGGAASDVWMQIVADVLQAPVQRLQGHPGSALGVALTAAVAVGQADWDAVTGFVKTGAVIAPDPSLAARYDRAYARFHDLYARLKGFHG
ncbi:FGGY-family carbohydrate kinase [Pseudooceanicola sp. CBS1P-1]|uniref:Carbohydrate kinase n=1 Tax=Pseudooceanicola albus TaxID=2692189 RepID=A0A6L7G7L8_9RHOB|nr:MULTISPECIES: FGGY-family carbohydrate kinase [Pseudooceanicola]MBT9385917.1 FGGY-family carbohydrate kinase [Pseudooceanicola endophyticus]MXN19662.1 carbohydrate kinase [Pseudooceanicola albus]